MIMAWYASRSFFNEKQILKTVVSIGTTLKKTAVLSRFFGS